MTKNVFGFIALAIALLSVTATPAFAAKECLTWSHPGQDVNTRTLRETVAALGFPEGVREKAHQKYAEKVVQMPHVETVLDELGYKDAKRKAVIDEFRKSKKQFWGFGGLKLLQLPPNVRQRLEVMTADRDTKEISAGYRLENFLYGKDKKAPCAVFQPAKGEPQTVTLNIIEVEHEGTIYTVEHSEICSNAGKKTRPAPTAKALPKPTAKVVSLESSIPVHTTIAAVYEVIKTDFLKRIQGKQPRELLDEVKLGKADGSIRYYEGKGSVRFTMDDMEWAKLAGAPVALGKSLLSTEEVLPSDIGPGKNAARVELSQGQAKLTLPRSAITEASRRTTELFVPDNIDVVYLGPVLKSCGLVSVGCGGGQPKEWYRQVHELGWQWTAVYFFVVKKQ